MARRLLYLISELEHTGAAHQLALLACSLPRTDFDVCVCCVGGEGPVGRVLKGAGVAVESIGWQRLFDIVAVRRLRNALRRSQHDLIHVFGLPALRWMCLTGADRSACVASSILPRTRRTGRLGVADQWMLRGVSLIVARTEAEKDRYIKAAAPADRIAVVPLGVDVPPVTLSGQKTRQELRLSPTARLVACAGRLEAHKGYRDAIWTLDILRFIYPDLHLLLMGSGPNEAALRWFAAITASTEAIHFLGDRDDDQVVFQTADVVWAPDLSDGGLLTTLRAMAAGRPVIASRLPSVQELVCEGETGFLVRPGDKAALARHTRILLDDKTRADQMGNSGRERVAAHFSAEVMVRRFAELYRSL